MSYFFLLASSSSRYERKNISNNDPFVSSWIHYLGCTQLALTFVPSVEFGIAEGFSSLKAALLLGDLTWSLGRECGWEGQVDTGCRSLEVITLWGFEPK